MQLLLNMADDEFAWGNSGEDETRILSVFSLSKKSTRAGFLIFGAKNIFNLLWHIFI